MIYFKRIFIISSLTLCTGIVLAHSGASGIVKQRMDAMSDMGDKSKLVADMFKGKVPFDKAALEKATDAFIEHGAEMFDLFPDTTASRNGSSTEALPAIWENLDEFSAAVDKFLVASKSLKLTIAETNDPKALKTAFFKTTRNCSGCHKKYRRPKK